MAVYDEAGNSRVYYASELSSLGFQTSFSIVDQPVTTATLTAPALLTEGNDLSDALGLALSNPSQRTGTVSVTIVSDGPNAAGAADVAMAASTTIYSLTGGSNAITIALPTMSVLNDQLAEGDETITLRITAPGQVFDNGTDTKLVTITLRDNDQRGTDGADRLTGSGIADELFGLVGDDMLLGEGGDDLLDGGTGADTVLGGAGDDVVRFSAMRSGGTPAAIGLVDGGEGADTVDLRGVSASLVTVRLPSGEEVLGAQIGEQQFEFRNVERVLFGAGGDYVATVPSFWKPIELRAGDGNDYLVGRGAMRLYGEGGDGRFSIAASDGPVGAGLVDGGEGVDDLGVNLGFTIDLAAGTAVAGGASYTVAGIENVNVLTGGRATTVRGDEGGNLFRVGSWGDDGRSGVLFDGRGGADTLLGSVGADTLLGGSGDDTLSGGLGNDVLDGGDGVDTVTYADAARGVTVRLDLGPRETGEGVDRFVSVERVVGSAFADFIYGSTGRQELFGGAGDDRLLGLDGNDLIVGGAGRDQITGGAGADTFRFDDVGDFAAGTALDTVSDFSRTDGDKIDLTGVVDGAFRFLGTGSFSKSGMAELRYTATNSALVELDLDGNGVADARFRVSGQFQLEAGDFLL